MRELGTVVLLRHGESTANAEDRFAGRLDVGLTERGREQARAAARLLAGHALVPDEVHTSLLVRAIDTAVEMLPVFGRPGIAVQSSRRLNERHYGVLQGRRRDDARAEFGAETVAAWRRSYAGTPPQGESLADVRARVVPYWQGRIQPVLRRGRLPLVVAHGNLLRALIMYLEDLSPEEIGAVKVPTGVPLLYRIDPTGRAVALEWFV